MRLYKQFACVAMVTAFGSVASAQEAGGFADCESSLNFGWNTARQLVGSVFSRINCGPTLAAPAEEALARAMKNLVLSTSDSDANKLCYYEGLYSGYLEGLIEGYGECSNFGPLSAVSMARAAEAVAVALVNGLPDVAHDQVIEQTFFNVVQVRAAEREACALTISLGLEIDLGASPATRELASALSDAICLP